MDKRSLSERDICTKFITIEPAAGAEAGEGKEGAGAAPFPSVWLTPSDRSGAALLPKRP